MWEERSSGLKLKISESFRGVENNFEILLLLSFGQRSRLGRIVFASSMEEILRFCDGFVAGDIPQVLLYH